jgi:transcription initiation factor IIF auxiliary subunit
MKLVNTYEKMREDWYSWTISLQGSDDELSQIRYVTYLLHESFANRRIVSKDALNNFARTLNGWGEFLLQAEVIMKSGEKKTAELWLDLGFDHTKHEKERHTGVFK